MKIGKYQGGVDGGLSIVFSSLLFLLFSFNLIQIISSNDYSVMEHVFYTAPYLLSSVLIFILGWKKSLSYILLIVAVITTINTSIPYDLSGAFFFCLAVYMRKNNIFNVVVVNVTIILLTLRSMGFNDTIPQTLANILGYFALYALFYFIVYRPCVKPLRDKEKLLKNFTDQEKQLIKLLRSGETQKTAGHIMSLSSNGANDMLKKLKKESGCKTTIEFFSSL